MVSIFDISIPVSNSLKDKRKVLQRMKMIVRNKFNVSIAETGQQDKWNVSEVTLAMVAPDKTFAQKNFDAIIKIIEEKGEAEVTGISTSEHPVYDFV